MTNPSPTRPLAVLAAALALSVAAACGGGGEGLPPTPVPSPTPAAATPTPQAQISDVEVAVDDAQLARLRGAVESLGSTEPFQFTLAATLGAAVSGIALDIPVAGEGAFSPPDASRATVSLDMGFVFTEFDTVAVGGETFITDPQTGEWQQTPGEAAGLLSSPIELIGRVAAAAETLVPAGRGTIDGMDAMVLRADDVSGVLGPGDGQLARIEAWITESDLRVVRLAVEGDLSLAEVGAQFHSQIGDGPGRLSAQIGLSSFGEAVSIEVPEVKTVLVDGKLPGEKKFEQINLTIDFGESHPDYNSVPATSGWHYGPPTPPHRGGSMTSSYPTRYCCRISRRVGSGCITTALKGALTSWRPLRK